MACSFCSCDSRPSSSPCLTTSTMQIADTAHAFSHFFTATLPPRVLAGTWRRRWDADWWSRAAACFNTSSIWPCWIHTKRAWLVWRELPAHLLTRWVQVERWATDAAFWLDPCRKRASLGRSLACGLELHYSEVESAGQKQQILDVVSVWREKPAALMKQSDERLSCQSKETQARNVRNTEALCLWQECTEIRVAAQPWIWKVW